MKKVTSHQLERFPVYLKTLKQLKEENISLISSSLIANRLGLSEEQVRKDFQVFSKRAGKPKTGRNINILISDLEDFLGYSHLNEAIIIGVGNLGQALISYRGFNNYGLDIIAGFDVDESKIGSTINGKPIYAISDLEKIVPNLHVKIAIIAVPLKQAQEIFNRLKGLNIEAIWNFAPIHLSSKDIIVENVDLAVSLAKLSHKLKEKEGH